jgi:hypothetical protein
MSTFDPTLLDNKTFDKVIEEWQKMLVTNPDASIRLACAKVFTEQRKRRKNSKN